MRRFLPCTALALCCSVLAATAADRVGNVDDENLVVVQIPAQDRLDFWVEAACRTLVRFALRTAAQPTVFRRD
jgi:hypothetical protein